MTVRILIGDCRDRLRDMPDASVHCVVTSPPYFGLRDYGHEGQIGLEPTPDDYVERLVDVFREVRRVLRDDGTLWLNLGDSYFSTTKGTGGKNSSTLKAKRDENGTVIGKSIITYDPIRISPGETGLKPKDLIGIPWRVALALQTDGWYLRQDIIWHKPNPMPESVRDRCTKAHEYIFLLTKSPRYYFDQEAIKEDSKTNDSRRPYTSKGAKDLDGRAEWKSGQQRDSGDFTKRNKRSVWTVTTKPFRGAHFAAFPPDLIEPCILAGCPEGGTVLDPFFGSGTTGLVADELGRDCIGIELNPEYAEMARRRIARDGGMFAQVEIAA